MAIRVVRPSIPKLDEYIEEIRSIFEIHYLTNMGPIHEKLKKQLIEYLGVQELSLFVNGHMALEMAIQAFDLTGEVITTPYTFASTTHAIVRNGLMPVFCDIKPDDYTIDPGKIEALVTEKTSAILPVHVYGNLCDVEAIEAIAKEYGLKVIYDAAHAFGITYKGVGVGNFGDASMFSFHATKVFNTIEGGGLAFKDRRIKDKLKYLKNFGICGEDTVVEFGGNAKMDEFRAAMGICNLRYIDEEIAKRARVFAKYQMNLEAIEGLRISGPVKDIRSNYAYFPIYIDAELFGVNRDTVYEFLKSNHVYARRYFFPATNTFKCYQGKFDLGCTPIAEDVSQNILVLPMYADLLLEQVDRICDLIISMKK